MAVSTKTLTRETRAAINLPSGYIADFAAPSCVPAGIEKLPGSSDWKGIGRRVSKYSNVQVPAGGLARAALTQAVRGTSSIDDYTLTIAERSYEEAFDTELGGGAVDTATNDAIKQNVITRKFASFVRNDRETEVAALLKNTSVMTQGLDASVGSQVWTDPAVNPIEQMQDAYNAVLTNGLEMPTRAVFSLNYWQAFINNPNVQALFGDDPMEGGRDAFERKLTNFLGGFNPDAPAIALRVASAVGSQTNEGQASPVVTRLYDSHFALLYVPVDIGAGDYVDLEDTCAIKSYEAFETYVDSYEDPKLKVEVHRVQEARTASVFDATLGYCIRNAV